MWWNVATLKIVSSKETSSCLFNHLRNVNTLKSQKLSILDREHTLLWCMYVVEEFLSKNFTRPCSFWIQTVYSWLSQQILRAFRSKINWKYTREIKSTILCISPSKIEEKRNSYLWILARLRSNLRDYYLTRWPFI